MILKMDGPVVATWVPRSLLPFLAVVFVSCNYESITKLIESGVVRRILGSLWIVIDYLYQMPQ